MKKTFTNKHIAIIAVIAIMIFFAMNQYQHFMTDPLDTTPAGVVFTIAHGSSLNMISHALYDQGLTSMPPWYLDLYGRLQNKADLIKAGEYHIKAGTTLPALLDQFIAGKVTQYSYTIVEGTTAQQLVAAIRQDPHIKATSFTEDLNKMMAILGKPGFVAEGWFLPETYHFPAGTNDVDFLKRTFQQMTKTLDTAWQHRDKNLPYKSPYEALTMASIIEKETGVMAERPLIAGVFIRRLRRGMRLQTDPTVIYGLGERFDGNLRKKDLLSDTPYNTYTRAGLPPSPICLPSKESIYAALHPAAGKALYFVASGKDGRHIFSTTLREHNKAVRRYQLNKK